MFASVCIITFVSANLDFDCDASFTHLDSSFITSCYIFAGKEQVSGGREGFCISYRDNKVLFIKNKVLSFLGNIWIQWSRLVIILRSGDHVADLHVGTEFVMCVCVCGWRVFAVETTVHALGGRYWAVQMRWSFHLLCICIGLGKFSTKVPIGLLMVIDYRLDINRGVRQGQSSKKFIL